MRHAGGGNVALRWGFLAEIVAVTTADVRPGDELIVVPCADPVLRASVPDIVPGPEDGPHFACELCRRLLPHAFLVLHAAWHAAEEDAQQHATDVPGDDPWSHDQR